MNDMIKKKTEIMGIVIELFYKKGLAETTISEIAYSANIDKRVFYEYFKNKDDLIKEYISNYFQEILMQIEKRINTFKTNREKLLFITETLLISKDTNKKFIYFYLEIIKTNGIKKYDERLKELIEHYIQKGIQNKEFKPCDVNEITLEIICKIVGNFVVSSSYDLTSYDLSHKLGIQRILNSIEYETNVLKYKSKIEDIEGYEKGEI